MTTRFIMRFIALTFASLLSLQGLAQAPAAISTPAAPTKPLFIKGTMDIRFSTRSQTMPDGKIPPNVVDTYTLNINVSNSALFHGTITQRPLIKNTFGSDQTGNLTYALDCDVINPNNPVQSRNIGKLYGIVPVDDKNLYHFSEGGVKISVFPAGIAKGFDSRFTGLAIGKPPANSGTLFDKVKKDAIRLVSGKGLSIILSRYDKMELQNHVLAAGPVQIYPEAVVNGNMLYDYDRNAWYFHNVSVVYGFNGQQFHDVITGNIRWVEAPDRKTSGLGEYQFDIKLNEAPPSEATVFAGPSDEAAFFAADDATPGLIGTMKYKDTMSGESVSASAVEVDLKANRLTKQQVMILWKLLFVSSVVPMNAE